MDRPSTYEAIPAHDEPFAQEKEARKIASPTAPFIWSDTGSGKSLIAESESLRASSFAERADRRLLGWRAGVTGVSALVFSCLLVNVSFLIWAMTKHRISGGIAVLQEGSCQTSANLNTGIHLLINLLSTGMLSGSNYCMQRLSAPTRHELDEAHRRHKWVDIGVPSIRNLFFINRWRMFGWLVLAASSLPLHLFYNSAVFAQISAAEYVAYVVDPSFLNGASFNASGLAPSSSSDPNGHLEILNWLRNNTHALQNLSNTDCIGDYALQMQTARGHVLAVTVPETSIPIVNNSLDGIFVSDPSIPDSFSWLCDNESSESTPCTAAQARQVQPWVLMDKKIAYCLSQPMVETCELQFSSLILIIVIICNVIKCITMLLVLWRANEPPIVTLGDCIATCLQDPDDSTAGMCLLDKNGVVSGQWKSAGIARPWDSRRRWWFSAASASRWIIGTVISCAGIIFTGVILGAGMGGYSFPNNHSIKGLWSMGFGAVNMGALVTIGDQTSTTLLSSTLLANTPQLILSLLYFSYNSVFTCELLSHEWNAFSHRRKPLRVTSPRGDQKSTYWLNLPYTYGLPLMLAAILLHWLFSRAIFLVNIQTVDPIAAAKAAAQGFKPDSATTAFSITQCGWSPSAVVVSIIVAVVVVLVGLLFGFRRYRPGAPLVGTCSAAIAAACHREHGEESDLVLQPLKWGVTSVSDGVGHCTFSAREVERPNRRDVYR